MSDPKVTELFKRETEQVTGQPFEEPAKKAEPKAKKAEEKSEEPEEAKE